MTNIQNKYHGLDMASVCPPNGVCAGTLVTSMWVVVVLGRWNICEVGLVMGGIELFLGATNVALKDLITYL